MNNPTTTTTIQSSTTAATATPYSARNKNQYQLSFKKRHKHLAYGPNYIPEEETIRNDYSLHYVLTGSRPQNHIQNTALSTRFAEYPKLKKLIQLKKAHVAKHAHPPVYIQADLRPAPYPNSFNLLDLLPARFDVIVIDPPLKESIDRYPHLLDQNPWLATAGGPLEGERAYWNWDELEALPIPQIAASPGFIFLWCGSGQGSTLEQGRSLLSKWGYRKCEDLVWIKTNHTDSHPNPSSSPSVPQPAVFSPTKEHCLMGIRGTVRRSTDGHFVHCNVDTDVIVSEPDPTDVLHKPEELYQLIENFCLGRRRLDLFGSSKTLRPGWLTIGSQCEPTKTSEEVDKIPDIERPIPYEKSRYLGFFLDAAGRTQNLLPTNADIDNLRPRSPPSRIAPGMATTGVSLPHGRAYLPGTVPIIGPDGTILGNAISGRNTISHPSGGLGRGPGNALMPGMRVSGLRDSNHMSNTNNNNNNHPSRNPQNPYAFQPPPFHPGPPQSFPFIHHHHNPAWPAQPTLYSGPHHATSYPGSPGYQHTGQSVYYPPTFYHPAPQTAASPQFADAHHQPTYGYNSLQTQTNLYHSYPLQSPGQFLHHPHDAFFPAHPAPHPSTSSNPPFPTHLYPDPSDLQHPHHPQ